MDHRKAMAMAAAATATAVAAVVAIGVNFGLFGVAAASGQAGRLSPAATQVETVDTVPPPGEQPPVVETIVVDAPAGAEMSSQPQLTPSSPESDDGVAPYEELLPAPSEADAQSGTGSASTEPYVEHPEDPEHPEGVEHPENPENPENPEDPGHELDD